MRAREIDMSLFIEIWWLAAGHNINCIIYLFIYWHLYSTFSIVRCSIALGMLWDGKIQGHTGQTSVREIAAHTIYNQWAIAPGRSLNNPWPESMTHQCTFSDNGVYVASHKTLVIVVSDQWLQILLTVTLGSFTCPGMALMLYMVLTTLHGFQFMRDTQSPMLRARFFTL